MKKQLIMLEQPILVSDNIPDREFTRLRPNISTCLDKYYYHNNTKVLGEIIAGIPELPSIDFSALSEEDCKKIGWVDFFEGLPVRWVKWTKRKPSHNGMVQFQFNGKNQGNAFVFNGELIKLEGLDKSDFKNYEDTFYWLEQDFNYKAAQSFNGKKFSEDSVRKAIEMAREIIDGKEVFELEGILGLTEVCTHNCSVHSVDKIIQSLSQPKVFDVECQWICSMCGGENVHKMSCKTQSLRIEQPKITNNSIKVIKVL